MHVAEGIGAARDHHHDHRRSDPQELVQEIRLHPRKPEILGVAAFAGRPVAEQAGEVADHGHAQVGLAGGGQRGPEAGPVLSLHRAALLVDDLDPWQLRRHGIDRGLHLEPQPETRVARQHMVGEGVAAHEHTRVRGAGPDDGHPAQRRAPVAEQRQRRPGLEQDDRPLGHLPGEGAVGGRVEIDGGRTGHRALGRPVRVEQPEPHLLGEEPPGGPVHEGLRQLAPPYPLHEAGAEADGVRQLDVDAGGERLGAGLVDVRGDAVHRRQERHRPVVGHDAAGESPLLPQQVGEQPVVRGRGDPVHVGVGVHHRAGARLGHGRLERRQDDIHELAPAHR